MKCKICNREAVKDGFCALHLKAYENVVEKFSCLAEGVKHALGAISAGDSEKFINWRMG